MLKDAQSVYPLSLSDLDTTLEYFNCGNGTLDLKERKVLPHSAAHMLSKMAGADFVKGAKCERWERFIDEIMMGDKETARYLQKLFGYCLTGNPKEEKLFILYGASTRNGKSTLLDTISTVMGDYARAMLPESLAEPRSPDGDRASPGWAEMRGVRMCAISEPSQSLHFNASKVKSVVGRNFIKARFLYANPFQFLPQFSIVIDTNHLPTISDPSVFKSGRVVIIPFLRHFTEEERDPNLKEELLAPEARSGILSWLLEGLRLYNEEGLIPPETIKAEIDRYAYESDKVAQFIDDCIESTPGTGTYAMLSYVYKTYCSWCLENGFHAESMKRFSLALTEKGYKKVRRKDGNCIIDVDVHDRNSFGNDL